MNEFGSAASEAAGAGAMKVSAATREGLSTGLARFLEGLSPEERAGLSGVLQDPRTFLAEDMTDVLAILRQLEI